MIAKLENGVITLKSESDEEREALSKLSHSRLLVVRGSSHSRQRTSVDLAIRDSFDHYDFYSSLAGLVEEGRGILEKFDGIYPATKANARNNF